MADTDKAPVITGEKQIRTSLGVIVSAVVVIFLAGAWATSMSMAQTQMKEDISELKTTLKDLAEKIR